MLLSSQNLIAHLTSICRCHPAITADSPEEFKIILFSRLHAMLNYLGQEAGLAHFVNHGQGISAEDLESIAQAYADLSQTLLDEELALLVRHWWVLQGRAQEKAFSSQRKEIERFQSHGKRYLLFFADDQPRFFQEFLLGNTDTQDQTRSIDLLLTSQACEAYSEPLRSFSELNMRVFPDDAKSFLERLHSLGFTDVLEVKCIQANLSKVKSENVSLHSLD